MKLKFDRCEVNARTRNQMAYIQAIENNTVTFSSGPAGCGKTFLAVAYCAWKLLQHQYDKLILVRPVIEAGEKLGSLPGEIDDKMDPYMGPFYDSLYAIIDKKIIQDWKNNRKLVISPIAYLRGRTFTNSLIIIDEAQNTTIPQMKLILSRIGKGSKMVITGDPKQSDISGCNGFVDALDRLQGIAGLTYVTLKNEDIQRDKIVKHILDRYE